MMGLFGSVHIRLRRYNWLLLLTSHVCWVCHCRQSILWPDANPIPDVYLPTVQAALQQERNVPSHLPGWATSSAARAAHRK